MTYLEQIPGALTDDGLETMQEHLTAILPQDGRNVLPTEILREVRDVVAAAMLNQYRITHDDWSNAENQAQNLMSNWTQLRDMTGQDGNLAPAYTYLANFEGHSKEILGRLRPHVYADPATMGRVLLEARALIDAANEMTDQVAETERKANQVLKTAQDAAAQTAANSLLKDFNDKAKDHKDSAGKWLGATVVASAVLGVAGFVLLTKIEPGASDTAATIREVSLKVAVLAVLAFAVAFAAKNYRANRHMQISYEMRGSIVKTALALRDSVEDGPTKDAIIEAMVVSVFSVADTGFSSEASTPSDPTITGALLALSRQGSSSSNQ